VVAPAAPVAVAPEPVEQKAPLDTDPAHEASEDKVRVCVCVWAALEEWGVCGCAVVWGEGRPRPPDGIGLFAHGRTSRRGAIAWLALALTCMCACSCVCMSAWSRTINLATGGVRGVRPWVGRPRRG
jgi:hypothetical protein